jgi:aminoglycoside phosphotransferase (APT) family kinase protein
VTDADETTVENKAVKLARLLGEELDATIEDLKRLTAGASRETWAFVADGQRRILQRSRFGPGLGGGVDESTLLRHAHAGGVTVPEIVASSATGDHAIGAQFTISAHIDGESIARKILRDDQFAAARECFVADCARELAAIHPVFDLAFRWLDENRPEAAAPRVVHGDFRMGNFLIEPHGVSAVLDWELAHLGDPVEDLGWLVARAWRFGGPGEVGGIGSRRELLDTYAAVTGRTVTASELRWWEMLASLRWGVITMFMGDEHRKGSNPSVEQAAIGRRVVETEYDVMLLLRAELESVR